VTTSRMRSQAGAGASRSWSVNRSRRSSCFGSNTMTRSHGEQRPYATGSQDGAEGHKETRGNETPRNMDVISDRNGVSEPPGAIAPGHSFSPDRRAGDEAILMASLCHLPCTLLDFICLDEHLPGVNARGGLSCSHLRSSVASEQFEPLSRTCGERSSMHSPIHIVLRCTICADPVRNGGRSMPHRRGRWKVAAEIRHSRSGAAASRAMPAVDLRRGEPR
jgi:hypothetical protein